MSFIISWESMLIILFHVLVQGVKQCLWPINCMFFHDENCCDIKIHIIISHTHNASARTPHRRNTDNMEVTVYEYYNPIQV